MSLLKTPPRRVVTGLDDQGRSCVIFDGPVPDHGGLAKVVWRTTTAPADNSGVADTAAPFSMQMFRDGGANFVITEIPPGMGRFMHATDTIDYLIILSGRVVLEPEVGEAEVGPGDFVVDRGTVHSWRNDGQEPAVMAGVTLPAIPLATGRAT